jgi:hypothetical protein
VSQKDTFFLFMLLLWLRRAQLRSGFFASPNVLKRSFRIRELQDLHLAGVFDFSDLEEPVKRVGDPSSIYSLFASHCGCYQVDGFGMTGNLGLYGGGKMRRFG